MKAETTAPRRHCAWPILSAEPRPPPLLRQEEWLDDESRKWYHNQTLIDAKRIVGIVRDAATAMALVPEIVDPRYWQLEDSFTRLSTQNLCSARVVACSTMVLKIII